MSAHPIGHRSFGSSTANPLVVSHEVAWGTEMLIVTIQSRSGAISAITYGGVAMTQVTQAGASTDRASIYRLDNPAVGLANISITFASTNGALNFAGGLNIVGIDKANPIRGTGTGSSAGAALEHFISSSKYDLGISAVLAQTFTAIASDGMQTESYSDVASSNKAVTAYKRGGSSVGFSYTGTGVSGFLQVAACSVQGAITDGVRPKLDLVALDSALANVGLIGPITDVDIKEQIDTIELVTFTLPRNAVNYSLLTVGRIVGLRHSIQGPRFMGKVSSVKPYTDSNGAELADVLCMGMAIELVKRSVYNGVILDGDSVSSAAAKVLANASGWATRQLGTGYVTMTERLEAMTDWLALKDVALVQNAAIRPMSMGRQLEVLRASRSNGIVLSNLKTGGLNNYYGHIQQLEGLEQTDVINRYIPQAVDDGNIIFDLGNSNRSSPYPINSLLQSGPSITGSIVGAQTVVTGTTRLVLGDINCTGRNRAIIMFFLTTGGLPGDVSDAVVINGATGKEQFATAAYTGASGATGTELHACAVAINVPKGKNRVSLEFPFAATANANIHWCVIALQDAPQTINSTNYRVGWQHSNATQSSGGAPLQSGTPNKDLALAQVGILSGTSITSNAGQTRLGTTAQTATDWKRIDSSGDVALGWTFASSRAWSVLQMIVVSVPVYYIEDSASIAAYELSEAYVQDRATKLVSGESAQILAGGNTLYDKYAYLLGKRKDPPTGYNVKIGQLPGNALDWNVGDYFPNVIYRGRNLTFETPLYCVSRTEHFNDNGDSEWTVIVDTKLQLPKTEEDLFTEQLERLQNVESVT